MWRKIIFLIEKLYLNANQMENTNYSAKYIYQMYQQQRRGVDAPMVTTFLPSLCGKNCFRLVLSLKIPFSFFILLWQIALAIVVFQNLKYISIWLSGFYGFHWKFSCYSYGPALVCTLALLSYQIQCISFFLNVVILSIKMWHGQWVF